MRHKIKSFLLQFGIPIIAIVVIGIHVLLVNKRNLTKWKGGGYGMYTGIHFYYDQIYIPGFSVDSLISKNIDLKDAVRNLKLMPNDKNLQIVAELVLKSTERDSVFVQIWKPKINSKSGEYSRVLYNEVRMGYSNL